MNHNIEHHDDLHIERFAEASSTSRKDDDDDATGRTGRWHSCRHAEPPSTSNHNVDLKDSGKKEESEG
jgi:hypothetical protein